jgi:hypothetical protein
VCHRFAVRVLPYQRLTIETFLSPDEVVRRLAAEVNPPPSMYAIRRSLEGWISDDAFEIRRPQTFWSLSSFRSVAKGRVVPGRMGANLHLTLTLVPVVRVFMSVWLWAAGMAFVGFAIAYLRGSTFAREAWPVGLGLLPFGYLACLVYFRVEAAQVIHRLRRLLGASAR